MYDVESPDDDLPDIPCDRGDPDKHLFNHHIEHPSRTRTQVDRLTFNSQTYIKNVVEHFGRLFGSDLHLYKTPMSDEYHPETDDTPLLDARGGSLYRGLIASANWAITLGHFDIQYVTQTLSRYSMAPREGHLHAMKESLRLPQEVPKREDHG